MKSKIDLNRVKRVVSRLKELDSQSVKFFDAKNLLLNEGYTEAEIAMATFEFPYDGVPNKPKEVDKIAEYLAKHPKRADKLARAIMGMEQEYQREQQEIRNIANKIYTYSYRFIPFFMQPLVGIRGRSALGRGAGRRKFRSRPFLDING